MDTLEDRLNEVMQACGWARADLQRISGESSSVISQWMGRGSKTIRSIGSLEAALNLSAASGYSALWLAKGKGPRHLPTRGPHVAEAGVAWVTTDDALHSLGQTMKGASLSTRKALGALLAALADEPTAYAIIARQITALVEAGQMSEPR